MYSKITTTGTYMYFIYLLTFLTIICKLQSNESMGSIVTSSIATTLHAMPSVCMCRHAYLCDLYSRMYSI